MQSPWDFKEWGYYARKAPKTVAKAHLSRQDEELLEKIKEIKRYRSVQALDAKEAIVQ